MKKILLFFCLVYAVSVIAQERLDDIGRISIHTYTPENEELPYESHKLLETKLSQIVTDNGIADDENFVRFILTAKINVISKDVVVGPPQRISQKLDIILILGDIEENKVFSQITIHAFGVGQNEEKAYLSAFKNLSSKNEVIRDFIQEGKNRILAYYQKHTKDILSDVRRLYSLHNYEDALFLLSSIPNVCTDYSDEVSQLVGSIYKDMIEARGSEFLNQAQAVWAKNPTKEGANEAVRLLSLINFSASCQQKAEALLHEITLRMKEIENREWNFQMQVYKDGVEREKRQWAQYVREQEIQGEIQKKYLSVAKEVAITYAKNQPKVVTRVINYNRVVLW